jgi:hypothetical protein
MGFKGFFKKFGKGAMKVGDVVSEHPLAQAMIPGVAIADKIKDGIKDQVQDNQSHVEAYALIVRDGLGDFSLFSTSGPTAINSLERMAEALMENGNETWIVPLERQG